MKRIISHFITLTLLMLSHAHTAAAYETEFKIVEGLDDNALKEIMEKNVNGMIQAFKTAADEQKKSVKTGQGVDDKRSHRGSEGNMEEQCHELSSHQHHGPVSQDLKRIPGERHPRGYG